MGEKYVTPPVISFESVFEQSTPFSPIVFILSPGADPDGDLGKLAERMGYGGNRLKFLAMGQGQEKVYLFNYILYLHLLHACVYALVSCFATLGYYFFTRPSVDVVELSLAGLLVEGS